MATTAYDGRSLLPEYLLHTHISAGDMKLHLQELLVSKGKQLEQAATLGQRVLAQQMELEERIRRLQDIDGDQADDEEVNSEARDRYRELIDTIQSWGAENAKLSSTFGSHTVSIPFFPSKRVITG
jgi:hypothetical protein